jgi:hypothetical protein
VRIPGDGVISVIRDPDEMELMKDFSRIGMAVEVELQELTRPKFVSVGKLLKLPLMLPKMPLQALGRRGLEIKETRIEWTATSQVETKSQGIEGIATNRSETTVTTVRDGGNDRIPAQDHLHRDVNEEETAEIDGNGVLRHIAAVMTIKGVD